MFPLFCNIIPSNHISRSILYKFKITSILNVTYAFESNNFNFIFLDGFIQNWLFLSCSCNYTYCDDDIAHSVGVERPSCRGNSCIALIQVFCRTLLETGKGGCSEIGQRIHSKKKSVYTRKSRSLRPECKIKH